ncbi:MAG: hypothetical protein RI946_1898, partial [Pseudomonadota bacterium]
NIWTNFLCYKQAMSQLRARETCNFKILIGDFLGDRFD